MLDILWAWLGCWWVALLLMVLVGRRDVVEIECGCGLMGDWVVGIWADSGCVERRLLGAGINCFFCVE